MAIIAAIDIGSNAIRLGFEFGDSPQRLIAKAGEPPGLEHRSDQLMSYFWEADSGKLR